MYVDPGSLLTPLVDDTMWCVPILSNWFIQKNRGPNTQCWSPLYFWMTNLTWIPIFPLFFPYFLQRKKLKKLQFWDRLSIDYPYITHRSSIDGSFFGSSDGLWWPKNPKEFGMEATGHRPQRLVQDAINGQCGLSRVLHGPISLETKPGWTTWRSMESWATPLDDVDVFFSLFSSFGRGCR